MHRSTSIDVMICNDRRATFYTSNSSSCTHLNRIELHQSPCTTNLALCTHIYCIKMYRSNLHRSTIFVHIFIVSNCNHIVYHIYPYLYTYLLYRFVTIQPTTYANLCTHIYRINL